MDKAVLIARILLGLVFALFGLNGFVQFLPPPEVNEAAGKFMGALQETGYMFPLIKVMPPIYTWRMRARVYRWYDELEQAEAGLADGTHDVAWVHDELDRIESEVQRIKVPLSFTDQLYHLRQHIDLVRRQTPAAS